MDKTARQNLVREIVLGGNVASQEELTSLLASRGVNVTQATLSRDLREMRIVKTHGAGGYFYRVQNNAQSFHSYDSSIVSIEFSGQMCVIRTRPGFASAVAAAVDSIPMEEIMGTIAGDDTIFVMLREGYDAHKVLGSMEANIPDLQNKLK
jgi:transcriptional regulator of arginine metabolism